MTRRLCIGSAGLIFIMLCLMVLYKLVLVPEQSLTYRLYPFAVFIGYFGTPLFYTCIGLLSTIMLRKCYPHIALPRIVTWLGLLMIISYVLMNVIYLSLPSSQDTLYLNFRNTMYSIGIFPQLLMVSGIFIGLGLPADQKADMLQPRAKVMVPVILLLLCMFYEVIYKRNMNYADLFNVPYLSFLIQIRWFFVQPLFYISLGILIMDGLFAYWDCPIYLPWLGWIGAVLLGLLFLCGICYIMQIILNKSMIRMYEVSEMFTLIGLLLGVGAQSSKQIC